MWEHLPLFPTHVGSFVLFKHVCHMPPRFASVPLWWGDGFFELAGGVCAWQLPLSVAPRDPSHGEWCPLLRPSSLGLFSASVKLVLSGAVLLCVLGHSDVRMQWAEVLRLLRLLLGNRCHLLGNRMPMKRLHPERQASSSCCALFPVAPSDPFSLPSVNVRWVGPNDYTGSPMRLLSWMKPQPLISRRF